MAWPADVLWRGGVHYLMPATATGCDGPEPTGADVTAALMALARSGQGRDAEAIVAALLSRPDWAPALDAAVEHCGAGSEAGRELMLGYMAAAYLQRHWEPLLRLLAPGSWMDLPDLFSARLRLPVPSDDAFEAHLCVEVLAARRQDDTGFNYAAEYAKIMRHLEGQWVAEGRLGLPAGAP